MKHTGKTFLTAAAISGLLAGAAANQGCSALNSGAAQPGKVAPLAMAPKVHDCAGDNECKGIGGCKTAEHDCKFKNSCKGKGGCHITEDDIKAWEKLQNPGSSPAAAKPS
jgi:hypothetical protein